MSQCRMLCQACVEDEVVSRFTSRFVSRLRRGVEAGALYLPCYEADFLAVLSVCGSTAYSVSVSYPSPDSQLHEEAHTHPPSKVECTQITHNESR